MFSHSIQNKQKLIEAWFVAGINPATYDKIKNSPLSQDIHIEPEILIQYPKESLLSSGHINVSLSFLF